MCVLVKPQVNEYMYNLGFGVDLLLLDSLEVDAAALQRAAVVEDAFKSSTPGVAGGDGPLLFPQQHSATTAAVAASYASAALTPRSTAPVGTPAVQRRGAAGTAAAAAALFGSPPRPSTTLRGGGGGVAAAGDNGDSSAVTVSLLTPLEERQQRMELQLLHGVLHLFQLSLASGTDTGTIATNTTNAAAAASAATGPSGSPNAPRGAPQPGGVVADALQPTPLVLPMWGFGPQEEGVLRTLVECLLWSVVRTPRDDVAEADEAQAKVAAPTTGSSGPLWTGGRVESVAALRRKLQVRCC
jgi:hypothetical protein